MIRYFFIIFACFFIFPLCSYAQISDAVTEITDDIFEDSDDESSVSAENIDEIFDFSSDSLLDINKVSYQELAMLGFLSSEEINGILNYKIQYGDFYTLAEIKGAGVYDYNIDKMYAVFLPEYNYEDVFSFKDIFSKPKNKLALSLKRNFKTDNNNYLGSPWYCALRYRFVSQHLKVGFSGEKDAGEKFDFNSKVHGFDFNSAYVCLNGLKKIESFIIGDYKLKIGQGIVHSNGYSMGKTSFVNDISKNQDVIMPNTSTAENDFLRGLAAKIRLGSFRFLTFASYKNFDASSKTDSTFTSFKTDGYHRTETELSTKQSVNEQVAGTNVSVRLPDLYIAYSFLAYRYDKIYTPVSNIAYEKIDVPKSFLAHSINYQLFKNRLSAFGEFAMVDNKFAFINGLTYQAASTVTVSLLQRYFAEDYFSHYASAFSERSLISNEDAVYLGISFFGIRKMEIKTYFDFFRHPWCTYYVSSENTSGTDILSCINYKLSRKTQFSFRARLRQRPKNIPAAEKSLISYAHTHSNNFKFKFRFQPLSFLTSETAVLLNYYSFNHKYENGYAIYQNLKFAKPDSKSFIVFRSAVFNTTYNTRIYAAETSVNYNFTSPCYYGNGQRISLCAQTVMLKKLVLQAHLSRFNYFDANIPNVDEIVFCLTYNF